MRSLSMNPVERVALVSGVLFLALGFTQAPAGSDEDPVVVAQREVYSEYTTARIDPAGDASELGFDYKFIEEA